jgi:hypothetical protein
MKEVFYSLKVGGYIVIQYRPEKISLEDLEKELFLLMKDGIDIVRVLIEEDLCTIVSQKLKHNISKPNGINEWSFGILTRGTTDDIVDGMIQNIRKQKIPHYEIILCGKYGGKYLKNKDIVYIEFTQKDDKGWITKKKNLISEKAKYENLCVMHDRIKLHDNWFSGMKKYGNNWEILSIPTFKDGVRLYDWLTTKYPIENKKSFFGFGSHLDYSDWDKWLYIDGGVIIMKKYVWAKVPWDETRYWNEAEDLKLSHDQTRYGFVIRLNPHSSFESFRFNHPLSKITIQKNPYGYGRLKGPFYIIIGKYLIANYNSIKYFFKRK